MTQKLPFFRAARRLSGLAGTPVWLAGGGALALVAGIGIIGPARLLAQIEGDRGIPPVIASGDIEVHGVQVDTTGKTAAEARANGWREAYRQAWAKVGAAQLDDGSLAAMVAQVEVEHEQVGPHRYIASLGVVFDRAKASQFVAEAHGGGGARSAPMLVLPVLYSGGVAQVYEVKGPWQRAWAEFNTGASAIDYVRPVGAGGDSLILTAGQAGRRSRLWWRGILDQFGASDVLIAEARLERQWPGGPVNGTFTARYGPDNKRLAGFTLTAPDEGGVPAMLNDAVTRMDQLYATAMASGELAGDGLSIEHPEVDPALAQVIAAGQRAQAEAQARAAAQAASAAPGFELAPVTGGETPEAKPAATPAGPATAYTVQFASPDAAAVDQALAAVRAAPGTSGAATVSIAIGGISVMRVTSTAALAQLAAALRERGWQVTAGANVLRIRRAGA